MKIVLTYPRLALTQAIDLFNTDTGWVRSALRYSNESEEWWFKLDRGEAKIALTFNSESEARHAYAMFTRNA